MYQGRKATFAITLAVLMLTIIPVFTQFSPIHTVAATKPQPPSSTSATWSRAYNIPYSYSLAESVAQTSSGGYVVGASCTAAAVTTPNCNTLSEPTAMVMRVDSSGNIQSHILYTIESHPIDRGRRRHLRRQRAVRLSHNRTDQLWHDRQSGLERERSMGK